MQESWLSDRERSAPIIRRRCIPFAFLLISSIAALGQTQSQPAVHNEARNEYRDKQLTEILSYIRTGWDSLTRSTNSCSAVADSKLAGTAVLYLPAEFPPPTTITSSSPHS